MGTTNYTNTFIHVAEDCPAAKAEEPPAGKKVPTVARLQYELLARQAYALSSDDVLFAVHAERHGIPEEFRKEAREAFFAKDQACLRSSPLGKRYGWGIHHDTDGHVALVPLGSEQYEMLAADPLLRHTRAMRSKRG